MTDVRLDHAKMKLVAGELDDDRRAVQKANKISEPDTGVPFTLLSPSFSFDSTIGAEIRQLTTWLDRREGALTHAINAIKGEDDVTGKQIKTLRSGYDA